MKGIECTIAQEYWFETDRNEIIKLNKNTSGKFYNITAEALYSSQKEPDQTYNYLRYFYAHIQRGPNQHNYKKLSHHIHI